MRISRIIAVATVAAACLFTQVAQSEPAIPEATYSALRGRVAALGYDASALVEVPQRWEAKP